MVFQMPAASLKLAVLQGLRLGPRCVPAGVQDPGKFRRKRAAMGSLALRLTGRDEAILDALTRRVRVFSVFQVARHWWPGQRHGTESALARLTVLESAGLLKEVTEWAHPELNLVIPILSWKPADGVPNLGQVSYRLKSRWTEAPTPVRGFIATRSAGAIFAGSGGRQPRPSEMTHDLHLAAIFLRILSESPRIAQSWVSEAAQHAAGAGRNERLPDALIKTRLGTRVLEFGGAYSKRKLAEFHAYCSERSLPYEIW